VWHQTRSRLPKCGRLNLLVGSFCDKCGSSLFESKTPAPAVDYSKPQSYTPKFLAEKILSTGKSMEGERKLVTVLFADVAGYTAMSEKLDPEEVHQIMEGCFQILMDEIHRYERHHRQVHRGRRHGALRRTSGPRRPRPTGLLCCPGNPEGPGSLRPEGGEGLQDTLQDEGWPQLWPRHRRLCGKDLKMDYTLWVIRSPRLPDADYGRAGRILVSADVYKMARDFFNFKARGKKEVKGKEEAVEAYELLEPTRWPAASKPPL